MAVQRTLIMDVDGFAIRRFRSPLVAELLARNCEVTVAAPGFSADDRCALERTGATTRTYRLERTGLNPWSDLHTKRSIRDMMHEVNPDAVLCRAAKAVAYGLPEAASAGIRTRIGFMTGLGSMFNPESTRQRFTAAIGRRLIMKGLRQATQVWVMNRDNRQTLTELDPGLGAILDMDSSGVDTRLFQPAPLPPTPTFCFIGRLLPAKGATDFIAMAEHLRSNGSTHRFIVAGEPDRHRDSITAEQVQSLHEQGVIDYRGFVEDTGSLIRESTALILPSRHEGRSRSLMEALACGRPVITSDAPGCHDAIDHGIEGLVVPRGDVEGLCRAVRSLGEAPEEVQRMGDSARKLAVARYDQEKVARRNADAMLGIGAPDS